MKKYIIYICLAIASALLSTSEAEAQIANTVPQPNFTIDTDIYELRFATMPNFHYIYDDITQYAPAALTVGLKAFGYEGRTKWGGMLVSDAFSVGIMAATVKGVKYIVNRQRPIGSPDGMDHSFPSGHTATSFMTATMLYKEYGWRSPWFSIGGYTVAALTGVSRIMNNAHWLSDVMAGAAVGIGSVHLGYYLTDLIFKGKHLYDGYEKPVFEYNIDQKHYVAEMFFARRFILGDKTLGLPFRGSVAGVQTDIPVVPGAGLSARVYAGSMKYSVESTSAAFSASAGGFYNVPFAKRFEFQARGGLGYAGMNGKNGMNLTAGAGLSFMLDSNFKIKGFAEYEAIGLLPASPWIHSILLGYSVGWFW
jgi:hypothetical protein